MILEQSRNSVGETLGIASLHEETIESTLHDVGYPSDFTSSAARAIPHGLHISLPNRLFQRRNETPIFSPLTHCF